MLGADFDTVYEQPILMGPVPYQYGYFHTLYTLVH